MKRPDTIMSGFFAILKAVPCGTALSLSQIWPLLLFEVVKLGGRLSYRISVRRRYLIPPGFEHHPEQSPGRVVGLVENPDRFPVQSAIAGFARKRVELARYELLHGQNVMYDVAIVQLRAILNLDRGVLDRTRRAIPFIVP